VCTLVRRACIDIGSNTTRLLVADRVAAGLVEVHQERAFTKLGRGLRAGGVVPDDKLEQVIGVVRGQLRTAHALGAVEVTAFATAAIRRAANGDALVAAIARDCGITVAVLSGEEEARLAFLGAARTLGRAPSGELGVVDVGGGSSELVVGTAPDHIRWSRSFAIGSADLAERCLHSDPPSAAEFAAARDEVARATEGLHAPKPAEAVAVGGSATSLRQLAGPRLDGETIERSLRLLGSRRAADVARDFGLDLERVRLLPAGLLILERASDLFGAPLEIARGGVREGLLLEATG
jgi:exopolyphosphatase / guanosine-5'-triphosphate,3'-diphosphate pyrophosphatase